MQVEQIAKDLGVSKGSYYYYFPNRDSFIREILDYSLEISTEDFIKHAKKELGSLNQLRTLSQSILTSRDGKDFDFYLRDFAKSHRYAKKIVQKMDTRRISYISKLLNDCGIKSTMAADRARILYHYYLGWYSRFKNVKLNSKDLILQLRIFSELIGVNLLPWK